MADKRKPGRHEKTRGSGGPQLSLRALRRRWAARSAPRGGPSAGEPAPPTGPVATGPVGPTGPPPAAPVPAPPPAAPPSMVPGEVPSRLDSRTPGARPDNRRPPGARPEDAGRAAGWKHDDAGPSTPDDAYGLPTRRPLPQRRADAAAPAGATRSAAGEGSIEEITTLMDFLRRE